jgi:hypothetical protein
MSFSGIAHKAEGLLPLNTAELDAIIQGMELVSKPLKLYGTLINITRVLEDYDRLQVAFLLQQECMRYIAVFLNRWNAPRW